MNDDIDAREFSQGGVNIENDITFRGLASATLDTIRLYRLHSDKVTPAGALVLVGMKAAFPEKFTNDQLLHNQNFIFFNHLVWLSVEVNDAVDINPMARNEGRQGTVETIFDGWKKALRATRNATTLNPQEQESNLQLMDNYQREILFLEKSLRETPDDQLDLEQITRYRELMNAISTVHNAAALLGTQELSQRLTSIPKQEVSIERLQEKYDWLTSGTYQNDTERKLTALFNTVMGVQVIDDWADLDDDQKLSLRTFSTEVVKKYPDDFNSARKEVFEIAESYFGKSEHYGFSKFARIGIDRMFRGMKKFQRKFPQRAGGRRERLLNGGEQIIIETDLPYRG